MRPGHEVLLRKAGLPVEIQQIYGKRAGYACHGLAWNESNICGVVFGSGHLGKGFATPSMEGAALMIFLESKTSKTRPDSYLLTEDGINWELVEYRGIFSDPRKNGWFHTPVLQIIFT